MNLHPLFFTVLLVIVGTLPTWAQSTTPRLAGRNSDRPALVFLVAGQSNANGSGVLSPEIYTEDALAQKRRLAPGTTAKEIGLPIEADAFTHSYIWISSTKEFQAIDPSSNLRPPALHQCGHGMELPVVRELENRFPNHDIFVIKYARGGSNLCHHWNPENTSKEKGFYAIWLESFREGMAQLSGAYPEVRVIGLYWDQGESDGDKAADEYQANLTQLINVIRRDTKLPELDFFIRKHIFEWPNIDKIISAQQKIVSSDSHCHLIDIDLGSFEQNYKMWSYSPRNPHISSKGFVALTERLFEGPLKEATVESFAVYPGTRGISAPESIEPLFKSYCYPCHDTATAEADLDLVNLTRFIIDGADALNWQDIVDQMNSGEMPPDHAPQPSKNNMAKVVGDLTEFLQAAQKMLRDSGSSIAMRRLNRREYEATIKDLMGVNLIGEKLPDDPSARFDTNGQNQSLGSVQLVKYFSFAQDVARTALHWACLPRDTSQVLERKDWAGTEAEPKRIFEIMQKVRLLKEQGMTPAEAGLTGEEWPKYDPDSPNAQKGVWRGQEEYYERNLAIHSKGRMLSHDLLVEHVSLYFPQDARARYKVRFCGGVVEGVKIRRGVRLTEKYGKQSGKHGRAFDSLWITGSIEEPSVHEAKYDPAFEPDFRPASKNDSRNFVFALEDKRGGPGFEQFYHHYQPIEPGVPKDTIFVKWMEVEGPFYDAKSPFELLVDKYKIATASDEELDAVTADFLAEFAKIAFRNRGVPPGYVDKLRGFYAEKRNFGHGFREAIVDPLAMILTSPRFLYLVEPQLECKEEKQLDAISLANRLSYFLWSGPPDSELWRLAKNGELLHPATLEQQVDRMLASPRAEHFFEGFMSQWIHLKRFDSLALDSRLLMHRTDGMIHASRREPIEFFKTLVQENLPASNLIDSDFVTVNGLLAMKYGLSERYSGDGFRKIQLPPDSPRGGLLTQAALLSTGTMGNRTSPVIRGSLVKEILLNDPPPPPPPNVPELIAAGTDPLASVRALVELHQIKPQCASCHARFDFIGLGLENFDAVGLWRHEEFISEAQQSQQIANSPHKVYPIDASGELPNGETFGDVFGLKDALMKQQRTVAASIFEGLLCYSLGRDVSFTDHSIISKALDDLEPEQFPVSSMIRKIVTSEPFRQP